MRFFFADSMDMIDPSFDFSTETRAEWRVRQRDDLYPHEVFRNPPYDGILVSKTFVDGSGTKGSRYSLAQRQRFWRNGVGAFFRLDPEPGSDSAPAARRTLYTMGDCGAFSYVREEAPPITTDEVIDFYERCGFDLGISVDHVILGFEAGGTSALPGFDGVDAEWRSRQNITLELANEFLYRCGSDGLRFIPMGVAQGWSAQSYAFAVQQLQKMGYRRIALGGMVPLKTSAILQCLEAIQTVRDSRTELHLLGVTRCEHVPQFQNFGVTSFDSTSPLRQAFKDDRDNYYTMERNYVAIRVPQAEGNSQLQARIRSGELSQDSVRRLERRCLQELQEFDRGQISVDTVLDSLLEYEAVHHPRAKRAGDYREILQGRPWKHCPCPLCRELSIQIVVFRGTDRNKRRGFHNLGVFFARLRKELSRASADAKKTAARIVGHRPEEKNA